jgi:hypothetical protein
MRRYGEAEFLSPKQQREFLTFVEDGPVGVLDAARQPLSWKLGRPPQMSLR